MGYKNVCVHCRVSFSEGTNIKLINMNRKCSMCIIKYLVSEKFKSPKKSDIKSWKIIEYLLENGYKFQNPVCVNDTKIYFKFPNTLQEAKEFIDKINET